MHEFSFQNHPHSVNTPIGYVLDNSYLFPYCLTCLPAAFASSFVPPLWWWR